MATGVLLVYHMQSMLPAMTSHTGAPLDCSVTQSPHTLPFLLLPPPLALKLRHLCLLHPPLPPPAPHISPLAALHSPRFVCPGLLGVDNVWRVWESPAPLVPQRACLPLGARVVVWGALLPYSKTTRRGGEEIPVNPRQPRACAHYWCSRPIVCLGGYGMAPSATW